MKELSPSANKHLKNIQTGDIYEGTIYLGIHDSPENYTEATEEEYQEWLNKVIEYENEKE